jgi:hypothetical protein
LVVQGDAPADLGQAFAKGARSMPRTRLSAETWRVEDDASARLRDKIVNGRRTLGEVYGAPLYGIKTGLNDAFVIDTPTRDRLVKADPKSAELLKPFLRGENVKRWRVEPEGLWLINTPKGKVGIDAYPAVRAGCCRSSRSWRRGRRSRSGSSCSRRSWRISRSWRNPNWFGRISNRRPPSISSFQERC